MSWKITNKIYAPGILDLTKATMAFSLRALSVNTYEIPAIRIRRSSDNTLKDFTPLQIDNGEIETWVGSGNGFVHTWYDQSGNGNHARQVANSFQPYIVENGSFVFINGSRGLDFKNGRFLPFIVKPDISSSQNFLSIDVGISTINDANSRYLGDYSYGTNSKIFWPRAESGNYYGGYGNLGAVAESGVDGNLKVFSLQASYSNAKFFLNGTLIESVEPSQVFTISSANGIGRASFSTPPTNTWGGIICERFLFQTQEEALRVTIENDIKSYYSIT